ncbi:PIM1 kinase, partial [Menura novaehollandiae]|nr:PIM1 kinase [Menura novaehollandiae]
CTSRGVLHCDIKTENIILDLATGEAKLIDFSCSMYIKDMLRRQHAPGELCLYPTGTQVYSPLEWILFHCYHGHPVMIWSLGIQLYDTMCRFLPFIRDEDIILGHYLLPTCQHLIRWCLSTHLSDRPSLEDLFNHFWLQ